MELIVVIIIIIIIIAANSNKSSSNNIDSSSTPPRVYVPEYYCKACNTTWQGRSSCPVCDRKERENNNNLLAQGYEDSAHPETEYHCNVCNIDWLGQNSCPDCDRKKRDKKYTSTNVGYDARYGSPSEAKPTPAITPASSYGRYEKAPKIINSQNNYSYRCQGCNNVFEGPSNKCPHCGSDRFDSTQRDKASNVQSPSWQGYISQSGKVMDEICHAAISPNVTFFLNDTLKYIAAKKTMYGNAFDEKLEEYYVFDIELIDILKDNIIQFFTNGQHISCDPLSIRSHVVDELNGRAKCTSLFHIKYLNNGCVSCPEHHRHYLYDGGLAIKKRNRIEYANELDNLLLGSRVCVLVASNLYQNLLNYPQYENIMRGKEHRLDGEIETRFRFWTHFIVGDKSKFVALGK